jgi:hypothetical protein
MGRLWAFTCGVGNFIGGAAAGFTAEALSGTDQQTGSGPSQSVKDLRHGEWQMEAEGRRLISAAWNNSLPTPQAPK